MTVLVHCPGCGKSGNLPDSYLGRSISCHQCKTTFTASSSDDDALATDIAEAAAAASPRDLLEHIGRFEVRARLGAGAFGTVYKAFDPQLDREVALKVPRAGTLDHPKAVERFLREAKAAAALRHPHIVPVYEAGRDGPHYYIVSAFIKGRTLARAVDEGKIGFRRAAKTVRDLAEALAYAHGLGIVHRDVKPANIMLDEQGKTHLMDFGLAYRQDSANKLTQDGAILGTPAYMAPEQARGRGKEALPATDQYSLGVLLYELLCGDTPFSGPPEIVLFNTLNQEPPPPSSRRQDIPRDLETVCLKAMAKQPDGRYADCQELADDLRRWLEGEPIRARRQGPLERVVRWCRREPKLAAAAGVVALCLAVVAAVALVSAAWLSASERRTREEQERADWQAEIAKREGEAKELERQWADKERRKTAAANKDAQDAQDQAQVVVGLFKKAANEARQNFLEAKRDQEAAERKQEEAEAARRRSHYVNQMVQARAHYEKAEIDRAQEVLRTLVPAKPGEIDLRGWEWYHLQRLCRASLLQLDGQRCVAFSADGKWLATVGGKGANAANTVKVYDAKAGQVVQTLPGHTKPVSALAFNPRDSQKLISAGEDGMMIIWNLTTGRPDSSFKAHKVAVTSMSFHPDGVTLATGSKDMTVQLWKMPDGKPLSFNQKLGEALTAVAFSPNGRLLAVATGGQPEAGRAKKGQLFIYDFKTGLPWLFPSRHGGGVSCLAFHSDSFQLISGYFDGAIGIFNAKSIHDGQIKDVTKGLPDNLTLRLAGHTGSVQGVAVSRDGKWIASASADRTVKVWNVQTSQVVFTFKGHPQGAVAVAFSPDGKRLASTGADNTVKVWDLTRGQDSQPLLAPGVSFNAAAFSPDGKWLAAALSDNTVKVWNVETGGEFVLAGHTGAVLDLAFNPDGRHLATAGEDHFVRVWDVAGRKEVLNKAHASPVYGVTFSPDGRWLASAGGDKTVKLWKVAAPDEVRTLLHAHVVRCVAFCPASKQLASAGDDGVIKIWDVNAGTEIRLLKGQAGQIFRVHFSPDGRRLASASADQTVQVWEAATGKEPLTLKSHTGAVVGVAFSRDGKRLASASHDGTVKIWDATAGHETLTLKAEKGLPTGVAFSPDGNRLMMACNAGIASVYDALPPDE